jgi:hypothetical protein
MSLVSGAALSRLQMPDRNRGLGTFGFISLIRLQTTTTSFTANLHFLLCLIARGT